jgi:hypothetical protein
MELVAERDGSATAFVAASHDPMIELHRELSS